MKIVSMPTRDQVIALAAIFQVCKLVDDLARNGTVPQQPFATSIHSLFEQNPASTEAVFGSVANLADGIEAMYQMFSNPGALRRSDRLRYFLSILHLQRKLVKSTRIMKQLDTGIDQAVKQASLFSETHDNVLANLADLYKNTISTFSHRIQVNGMAQHLQQPHIANRIRCLLLAGIRAAILWQQVGGNRLHLALRRRQIVEHLKQLRSSL